MDTLSEALSPVGGKVGLILIIIIIVAVIALAIAILKWCFKRIKKTFSEVRDKCFERTRENEQHQVTLGTRSVSTDVPAVTTRPGTSDSPLVPHTSIYIPIDHNEMTRSLAEDLHLLNENLYFYGANDIGNEDYIDIDDIIGNGDRIGNNGSTETNLTTNPHGATWQSTDGATGSATNGARVRSTDGATGRTTEGVIPLPSYDEATRNDPPSYHEAHKYQAAAIS